MSSKDKQVRMQEKFQAVLSTLLREEDNKYCADCEAKGPRWTSWNLGVFICIRCAGIHRNLGVHISKVKSVNLDQWTAEQIASMLAMGNSRAKAIYECNLGENYRRSQSDSAMEQFIRAKYEQRKWIDKNWTPAPITIPPHLIDDEKDKRSKQQGLADIKLKKESSGNSQTNTTSTTKKSTSSSDRKNELDSNNSGKLSSAAEKKPKQPVIEEPVLLDFDDASAPPPTTKASTTQNNVIGEDLFDNENFKRMNLNEPTVEMPTPVATTTTNTAQLNADLGDLTLIGGEDLNSRKALGNNSTGPIDKNSILALYNNINNNNSSSANSNLLNFATSTTNPNTNKPSPNHQYPNTNNNFGGFTANIPNTMTSPNIAAAAANQQQLFSSSLFGGANNGITNSHSLFNLSPQINNPPNFGNASSNQPKSGQFNQFNFAPTNNINNLMFPTTTNANKPSGQQQQQTMTNNNAMFNDLNFGPFTTAPTTTSNLNSATSASNTLPNIGNTLVSDLWN